MAVDGFILDEQDRDTLDRTIRRVKDLTTEPPRGGGRSPANPLPVRWGVATAAWDINNPNQVTVNPSLSDGTGVDTSSEVVVYISLPIDETPAAVDIKEGDVLGYLPLFDNAANEQRGVLVAGAINLGTFATPAVILPADFETEAAQSDSWDRSAPPGGTDGVSFRVQTRTAYNDLGDEILYAFFRTYVYDSFGKLATISAETRVTVDVPEICDKAEVTELVAADSPYTILGTDREIFANTDAGSIALVLPTGIRGKLYRMLNVGASGNDMTITTTGGQRLFGVAGGGDTSSDGETRIVVFDTVNHWW